jgi:hypothetical protein
MLNTKFAIVEGDGYLYGNSWSNPFGLIVVLRAFLWLRCVF